MAAEANITPVRARANPSHAKIFPGKGRSSAVSAVKYPKPITKNVVRTNAIATPCAVTDRK
jgi:hypothetical protein